MWLVLCTSSDDAALWAYDRLREVGPRPIELVTDLDLVGARWDHRIGRSRVRTIVSLADGRVIDSREVHGALNRFLFVPPALLVPIAPADRDYAAAELSALIVSWLAALGSRVLNPASARGFSGAWRSRSEWSMLASSAGLRAAVARIDSDGTPPNASVDAEAGLDEWHDWPPFAPLAEDVIVVGEAVFARGRLTRPVRRACRALARLSGTPLLGLRFRPDRATARGDLVSVTTLPDLRAGGSPLVATLAEAMDMGAAA